MSDLRQKEIEAAARALCERIENTFSLSDEAQMRRAPSTMLLTATQPVATWREIKAALARLRDALEEPEPRSHARSVPIGEFRERVAAALGVILGFRAALGHEVVNALLDAHETVSCADQSIVHDVRYTIHRRA